MATENLIDELLEDARERMHKSVEATAGELSTVRTGRASPSLLDRIHVDYYGAQTPLRGAVLRRACRVGGGAVLTPGVEIGEEAFVAAGALVTRDVPARAVVMGVPAIVVREVPERDLLERWL